MQNARNLPPNPILKKWLIRNTARFCFWLLVLLAMAGIRASQAQTIQTNALYLLSPTACPTGGCTAGQRLNMRVTFDLINYVTAQSPNVQVCAYTPNNWSANDLSWVLVGGVTGATYQTGDTTCGAPPVGYTRLGGVQASLTTTDLFGDSLDFSLRIGNTATMNGSVLIRVYEYRSEGWTLTTQPFYAVSVTPTADTIYVANDASTCGLNLPCYINSGSDLPTGFGTGLKDAIDSHPIPTQPATIIILGNYQIKSNTVIVDKPHTIQGQAGSTLTYSGSLCNQPMIRITAGGILRDLTINDGSCVFLNRDLVVVESPVDVLLEKNTLTEGRDAVRILDHTGDVLLQFNHITANSGYAVWRSPGLATGTVTAVANNLYANRAGVQAECNTHGAAEHNFWGFGTSAIGAVSQCTVSEGKRLGAPALPRTNAAGVEAEKVTVTNLKTYSFSSKVAYQRSGTGNDFDLYLVNHGFGSPENVPFTGGTPGSLTPCSNYYDIFLAEGAIPAQTLDLFFRYDLTAGCTATIENSTYCGGTDITQYPLWWYDPATNVTDGWDTTGQNPGGSGAAGAVGQQTTCNLINKEIQVSIDASGRPGINNDLSFTPFVVGLPAQSSSVVLTQFRALAGNSQAAIQWTTASEINTSGFYVLRSLTESGGFTRVSDFVPRRGSGIGGGTYEVVDTGLTNETTYYYRLEIVSASQESSFSNVISVIPISATTTATASSTSTITTTATSTTSATVTITSTGFTHTPTVTATITPTGFTQTQTITATITPTGFTPTPTITASRTNTTTPTLIFTFVPTRTRTRTPVIIPTLAFRSPTPLPTRTRFPTRTPTLSTFAPTSDGITDGYPAPGTITIVATQPGGSPPPPAVEGTGYPVGDVSITPIGDNGYPAPTGEVLTTLTAALTQTSAAATLLPPGVGPGRPGDQPGQPVSPIQIVQRYWPFLVGLLLAEILIVAGAVYYLIRRGWLKFPLW
jgi:hypothetical protein